VQQLALAVMRRIEDAGHLPHLETPRALAGLCWRRSGPDGRRESGGARTRALLPSVP